MNRTKKDWEEYCIEYLLENKRRFSVWWATENKFIANAMDRLIKSKRIFVTPLRFPQSKVMIRSIKKRP